MFGCVWALLKSQDYLPKLQSEHWLAPRCPVRGPPSPWLCPSCYADFATVRGPTNCLFWTWLGLSNIMIYIYICVILYACIYNYIYYIYIYSHIYRVEPINQINKWYSDAIFVMRRVPPSKSATQLKREAWPCLPLQSYSSLLKCIRTKGSDWSHGSSKAWWSQRLSQPDFPRPAASSIQAAGVLSDFFAMRHGLWSAPDGVLGR